MSTVKGRLFLAATQELPLTLRLEVEALFVKHDIEALVLSPSEMNMLHSPLQVFLVETTPNSITVGIHSLSTIPPTAREYIAQRLWEDKQVVEWVDDTAIRVTFPQEYGVQIMQLIVQAIISKVYVSLANMSGNQKLSFDHKAGLSQ